MIDFVISIKPSFVIITQAEAIQTGICDKVKSLGIPCIAPTKKQSELEESKIFSRNFIKAIDENLLPSYEIFTEKNIDHLAEYLKKLQAKKVVLKFDGLMNSQGVKIYDLKEGQEGEIVAQAEIWVGKDKGRVIVEEFVEGDEVSLMSFADGETLLHMPPVKNYKRIWENDLGENTSGMGAVTTGENLPFLSKQDLLRLQEINNQVFKKIQKISNENYVGVLFGEFIIRAGVIKVIEYNTRFGNPSTVNILNLLDTSFFEICKSMISGSLDQILIKWKNFASVSISVVPVGYPYSQKEVGSKIDFRGLSAEEMESIYFASLKSSEKGNELMNSRNLTVCITGEDIDGCRKCAISILEKINGPIYFRRDIGLRKNSKK
jgi:phosphoribosylamine--glycine ligase